MAVTRGSLEQIASTGYGPLTLAQSGDAYVAAIADQRAQLSLADGTVLIETDTPVTWPSGASAPDEIDRRVASALTQLAASRAELVSIAGQRGASSVHVSLWIDAEASRPHDLAAGVRLAILLGEEAGLLVEQVGLSLETEEQLLQEAQEAAAAARSAGETLASLQAEPQPAQEEPAAVPQAPAAVPAEEGPAAASASRHCPACGTANQAQHRFCVTCGTGLS